MSSIDLLGTMNEKISYFYSKCISVPNVDQSFWLLTAISISPKNTYLMLVPIQESVESRLENAVCVFVYSTLWSFPMFSLQSARKDQMVLYNDLQTHYAYHSCQR